jgi:hypothetical protein
VLSEISRSVKPGHTALLAEVTEQSPEVLDTALAQLGGTAFRRPVDEVEAELAAAEKAQREAERQATMELMQSRREHSEQEAHAKVEKLNAKLSHHEGDARGAVALPSTRPHRRLGRARRGPRPRRRDEHWSRASPSGSRRQAPR